MEQGLSKITLTGIDDQIQMVEKKVVHGGDRHSH